MAVNVTFDSAFAFALMVVQCIWSFFYTFIELVFPKRRDISADIVLVTGGASELGRMVAREFAKEGCMVVIWDSDEDSLHRVANDIKEQGGRVHPYKVDMNDKNSIAGAAAAIQKDLGTVSILVNNICCHAAKKFLDSSDEDIERILRLNTYAPLITVKAFLPGMLQQNKGHIVTIANTTALLGHPEQPHYSAAMKAALGMNESLRLEFQRLGMKGLGTTTVCPYYAPKATSEGTFKGFFSRFLPTVHKMDTAVNVVDAVRRNHPFVIRPMVMRAIPFLKTVMPVRSFDISMDLLGLTDIHG